MKPVLLILFVLLLVIVPVCAAGAGMGGAGGDGQAGTAMSGAQSGTSHSAAATGPGGSQGESYSDSHDTRYGSNSVSPSMSGAGGEAPSGTGAGSSPGPGEGASSGTGGGSSSGKVGETSSDTGAGTAPGKDEKGINAEPGPSLPDPIARRAGSAGTVSPPGPGPAGGHEQGMGNSAGPGGAESSGGPGDTGDNGIHIAWGEVSSASSSLFISRMNLPMDHGRGTGRNTPDRPVPATHAPYGEVPYGHIPAAPVSQSIVVEKAGGQSPKRKENQDSPVIPVSDPGTPEEAASPDPEPVGESRSRGIYLLNLLLLPGFSRLNRNNVLKNRFRNRIYTHICNNPGTDLGALAVLLGLNRQTTRYHIRMLVSRGLVSEFQKHGATRYFQNNGIFSSFKKTLIHYLCNGTQGRMLTLLMHRPGLSRQEVADTLGISGPSVTWHAKRLIEDGIIVTENEGAFTRYSLTEDAARELFKDPVLYKNSISAGSQYA